MIKFKLSQSVVVLIVILSIATASVFGADNSEPQAMPQIPMVRAMGGAFTAVSNDEYSVFYNPAGYSLIDKEIITAFSLGIKSNIDDSAIKLYNAIIAGKDITSASNITTYLTNVAVAPGVAGPIYFGRVGNNFGFAFYDNTSVTLSTKQGAIFPTANLLAYGDVGFVGGYAFKLPFYKKISLGLNLKTLLRIKSQLDGTVISVIDSVSNLSSFPVAKSIGFGADIGILYKPIYWMSIGVAGKDFFGTHFSNWEILTKSTESFPTSYIKPRIPIGIAVYPLATFGETSLINSMLFSLEYSDLLDYSSFLSNIKMGVSFNTLKIITIRGGFNGGYPSLGIGFKLKFFNINLAYFVDELGAYPGANPVQNLMFELGIKW